jgi:AcrR family transcriptional regulator
MSIDDRKQKEKHDIQEKILKAAMQLFCKDGYQNVTLRKIAKKIDYSPGTIYLYFKDKDEIFYQLLVKGFRKFGEEALKINEKDPIKRIDKLGETYIRFGINNPEYYQIMFVLEGPSRKIVEEHCEDPGIDVYAILQKDVRYFIEKKGLNIKDLEHITFHLWSLVHGIVSLIIQKRSFASQYKDIKDLEKFALRSFEVLKVTG